MGCARRSAAAIVLAFAAATAVADAQTAEAVRPPAYRVFLTDGRVLTSHGPWTRVEDRVVFSVPLTDAATPELHLVTLASSQVDWTRTERDAEATRARHYAATRAEADYATLSSAVAQTLNQVAIEGDPQRRLDIAQRARQALADWPATHFGYRAHEVREMVGMLDGIIAEMRVGAGLGPFELSLSAASPMAAPEPVATGRQPGHVVEQLMTLADLAETPVERVSLWRTVLGLLDRAVGAMPARWSAAMRRTALGRIAEEEKIDARYVRVRRATVAQADRRAAAADVRALERLRATLPQAEASLMTRRPGEMAALLATVDARLDSARQLRLSRDQWQLQMPAYRAYQRTLADPMATLASASPSLEDIRAMAGPTPSTLRQLSLRLAADTPRVRNVEPPAGLAAAHALFRSAWDLAENAVKLRLDAIASNSLEQARHASSAAAGALMLLTRARSDLDLALRPPSTLPAR